MPIFALCILLAGSSFGVVSPILKLAYSHGFSVEDVTSAQFGCAAVLLWVMAIFWRKPARLSMKQVGILAFLAVCSVDTAFCYYKALSALPASLGIVLLFQFTWMTLIIDIIVKRKLPTVDKWIGVVVILVGTVLAVGMSKTALSELKPVPVILGLLAALGYALTLYVSGYVDTRPSPALRSAVLVTFATVLMAIFVKPSYIYSGVLWQGLWIWGGLVAVFSQIIPLIFMLIGVPKVGGRMAGVLGAIELPVAVLAAKIMVGETVGWSRWLGVVAILIGIVISELGGLRKSRQKETLIEA